MPIPFAGKRFTWLAAAILLVPGMVRAQSDAEKRQRWQHLDPETDSVLGVSTDRAYKELLTKPVKPILVGVIDAGFDITHNDLQGHWWVNTREKPGNGKDDDKDGYVDDVNGWSFVGGLIHGNLDVTRIVRTLRPRYATIDTTNLTPAQRDTLALYRRAAADFETKARGAGDPESRNYLLNLAFDPYDSAAAGTAPGSRFAGGNGDILGPPGEAMHGTHVSGIIGALRGNHLGVDGIVDSVKIIPVRALVAAADERDQDVAAAIRYVVDHGARVMNLSLGKGYSPQKALVDEAVRYAMSKDVLIVVAAGNDGVNTDHTDQFPSPRYLDGGKAEAWLEVGASTQHDDASAIAGFSDYGKTTVDVFAPGVGIWATVPDQKYEALSGTSMAAPVVTGVAAVIRSRYPQLTAVQVKDIIMKSVTKINHEVTVTDNGQQKRVPFSDVCVSGGVVNLYAALKLAATYK